MMRRAAIGIVMLAALAGAGSAAALPDPVGWWTSKSDQYIWEWLPDLKVHGIAHGGAWGCPFCGEKIYEGRGHYPWLWHPDKPYKAECPLCHRRFPTNDYHAWMLGGRKGKLDTAQKFVDDGNGYVGPDGTRYPFVKYAIGTGHKPSIWVWTLGKGVPRLAAQYAKTGDERCAHTCALIMARIAADYPSQNPDLPRRPTQEQVRRLPYRQPPQGMAAAIGGYQCEAPYTLNVLRAYRQIYPYLAKGGDPRLRQFLAAKGITDVKAHIQWDLCHRMLLGGLVGNFVSGLGIQGLHRVLAEAALSWDMHDPSQGATTEYILDWIVHSGPNCVDEWVVNSIDRDGFGACEGLGYNLGHGLANIVPLAETLKKAGSDLYARPRVREAIRLPIKTIVAGKWSPSIGDGGSWRGFSTMGYQRYMSPAFEAYGDPLLAKALGEVSEKLTWESRNYPLFGLAILESGRAEHRRGLSCYYGGTTAHGHFDRLTFSVFNARGPVTPELGYPHMGSPERNAWVNNTASHNTVVVDARKQLNRVQGHLTLFAVTPGVQAIEVDGRIAYRGICSKYQRTLVWVDADERNSYLVDIFRVAGGSQHDYSLHGASAKVTVEGLKLVPQQGGTLAGPDVDYLEFYDDDKKLQGYKGSGYQYLYNVGKGTPTGGFVATWNHRKEGTPFLRVHVPAGVAEQALFADGLPPFGERQDALRYMFLRRGTCPPYNQQHDKKGKRLAPVGTLESTFVTVLEPLHGAPFIRRVERISGAGAADVALSITRADGATDLLICREERGAMRVGRVALDGRIALCTTTSDGEATRLALLDGVSLSCGQASVAADGPCEGTVRSVDYKAMALAVREKLPVGDALAGKTIVLNTPPRTTSFVIDAVERAEDGSRITLRGAGAMVYRGKVEKASNAASTVVLDSPIYILHAGTALAGMRLCNEDGSCNVRIKSFGRRWDPNTPWPPFGGTAHVEEGHDVERAFADGDGDGKVLARVYEFGPGDRYRIAAAAWLTRRP